MLTALQSQLKMLDENIKRNFLFCESFIQKLKKTEESNKVTIKLLTNF